MQDKQLHIVEKSGYLTSYYYNVMADDSAEKEHTDRLANRKPFPGNYYTGDFINKGNKWLILFYNQKTTDIVGEIGVGPETDGQTHWNWDRALLYQNKKTNNKTFGRDLSGVQFHTDGKWYVCGRTRRHHSDPGLQNQPNASYNSEFNNDDCAFFLVKPLEYILSQSAINQDNKIKLNWKLVNENHKTLIVRHKSGSVINKPSNNHAYSIGDKIGDGIVIYNNNTTNEYIDSGTENGSEYIYCFYTNNNHFYSPGVVALASTSHQPAIKVSSSVFQFYTQILTASESESIIISAFDLKSDIYIEVPNNYQLSTDNQNWDNNIEISSIGATIWLRYFPQEIETSVHNSLIIRSSDTETIHVQLTGTSFEPESTEKQSAPIAEEEENAVLTGTFPAATLEVPEELLLFHTETETYTESKKIKISAINLSSDIQVEAPTNYEISKDNKSWEKEIYLEAFGGEFYLRYNPLKEELNSRAHVKISAQGAETKYIPLDGTAYLPEGIETADKFLARKEIIENSLLSETVPNAEMKVPDTTYFFYTEVLTATEGVKLNISCKNIKSIISIDAPENYQVSNDNVQWFDKISITGTTDHIFLRYFPQREEINAHKFVKISAESATTKRIQVAGTAYIPQRRIEETATKTDVAEIVKSRALIEIIPDTGTFISAVGVESILQTYVIKTQELTTQIQISAPYNYKLSSNKIEWSNFVTLPASGGNLYIKYLPTEIEIRKDEIIELKSDSVLINQLKVSGFSYESTLADLPEVQAPTESPVEEAPKSNFWRMMSIFAANTLLLILLIFASRAIELYSSQLNDGIRSHLNHFIGQCLVNDAVLIFNISATILGIAIVFYFLSRKLSAALQTSVLALAVTINLLLIKYFSVALNPLGGDLFHYSLAEIKQTVGSSLNWGTISFVISFLLVVVLLFAILPRKIRIHKYISSGLAILSIISLLYGNQLKKRNKNFGSEYNNYLVLNKSDYFYAATYNYFWPKPEPDIFDEMNELFADDLIGKDTRATLANDFVMRDEFKFPFLHTDNSHDVLSKFMVKDSVAPNIVILIVEGLGRAFSNQNAYLGSFTPYLDSLSQKSLYWENCLSTAGRTFEVMPSVLGSLPYGSNGFCELGDKMPAHQSLLSILAKNGYRTNFFYGGDSKFDNMNKFMVRQNIQGIYDIKNFGNGYTKLPSGSNGFTWGYGDFELFRKYFSVMDRMKSGQPQASVILTVSTHDPFHINNQDKYNNLFDKRLAKLRLNQASISQRIKVKPQLASVMFMDDAVRSFFNEYKSRPEYANTIFIITGDHRMPDIPMSTKIDRYHVPLIIFSPKLKRTAKIPAVVSHLDITPSLLALLKQTKHFKSPELVSWLGDGLDTARFFRNINNYPLIQTKQGVNNYISGEYFWDGQDLSIIDSNMGLTLVKDSKQRAKVILLLKKFNSKNNRMINSSVGLVPDSILKKY